MNTRIPELLHLICKFIPQLILIAISGLIGVMVLFNKTDTLLHMLPFIILSIFAAFILWYKRDVIINFNISDVDKTFNTPNILAGRYYKVYAILFVITITWVIYSRQQDIVFLVLLFSLFAVSVFQIFAKTEINTKCIVLQLFLTSLLLTGSQLFCHPYFYGIDDIFPHSRWATGILESGLTLTEAFAGDYTHYPLFHIGIAITTMLSGINVQFSPYIVMLIPVLTTTIFVYYIAHHFTKSTRISAAASFFYLMIPVVLRYATSSMAFVMATFCFVMVVYILLREDETKTKIWLIPSILITIYTTLVHHMSVVTVVAGIGILAISYVIYQQKVTPTQIITAVIFCVSTIAYASKYVLDRIISIIAERFSVISLETVIPSEVKGADIAYDTEPIISLNSVLETKSVLDPTITLSTSKNQLILFPIDTTISETVQQELTSGISILTDLMADLVIGLLVCFLIFGLFYLGKKGNMQNKSTVLLPFCLVFLPIFISGVIELTGLNIEAFRFRLMMAPLYAVALGIGAFVLYQSLSSEKSESQSPKILTCVFCLMLVIASPVYAGSTDASTYLGTENEEVNYFNENDLELLEYVETYVSQNSQILSDHIIYRYYSSTNSGEYEIPYYRVIDRIYLAFTGINQYKDVEYVLLRHDLYERGELEVKDADYNDMTFEPNDDTDKNLVISFYSHTKNYENGFDTLYSR